jgi:hypothetical protein
MKQLFKFIVFILATLIVVSTIIVISLQSYLRQPEMIENIRVTASSVMGARVDFGELNVRLMQGPGCS